MDPGQRIINEWAASLAAREVSPRHVWWRLAAAGVPRVERGWIVSRAAGSVEDHDVLRRVGVRRIGNRFELITPTPEVRDAVLTAERDPEQVD
jgi:hypothetical protein